MRNKRGRPPGTTKDDAKNGVVRFRCALEEKGKWVDAARKRGLSLSEWIILRLNEEWPPSA